MPKTSSLPINTPQLHYAFRDVDHLVPDPRNSRKHSLEQIHELDMAIGAYGYTNPVLVDGDKIIAGHGRREAIIARRDRGDTTFLPNGIEIPYGLIPTIDCSGWTETQRRAYVIWDNKSAMLSDWNEEILAAELRALSQTDDFDMSLTGFNEAELDELIASEPDNVSRDTESVPLPPANPTTCRGDVWLLGGHRLMCGDSVSKEDIATLIMGKRPDMVYTDPPYGVSIVNSAGTVSTGLPPGPALRKGAKTGKVGGDKAFGKVGTIHRGMKKPPIIESNVYPEIIGDDSTKTAIDSYKLCAELKIPVMIFWGGNYYAEALPPSSCWIVWDKENGDSFFADAELAWTNQKTAVRVFRHMWNGLIKASERGEKRVHPTQKPVALAEWCFEKYGKPGCSVLDLFGGSGSTMIAAETRGHPSMLMEMSEAYCDVIVARWQTFTGQIATLEADGRTFDQVARKRGRTRKAA